MTPVEPRTVMKATLLLALVSAALFAAGCSRGLDSARNLRLPKGSAQSGKAAFISLQCTECHTVSGVDLPKPTAEPSSIVELGGSVSRLRTVGDLLTSIIHPSYSLSDKWRGPVDKTEKKSPMRGANDLMTVTQMVDLVTFLQPRYTQIQAPPDWAFSY
jgi:hypothetical protein